MIKKEKIIISLMMCVIFFVWGCGEDSESTLKDNVTSQMISTENTEESSYQIQISDDSTEVSTDVEQEYEPFEQYNIIKMNTIMNATTLINVRKGPNEGYDKFASIDQEQEVVVIGQCQETGWYMVEIDGVTGFVSNEYMVAKELTKIILGDECPYVMLVRTNYMKQEGWFFCLDGEHTPENYEKIVSDMKSDGFTYRNEPVYVGTWRDVGDVMWLGYSE